MSTAAVAKYAELRKKIQDARKQMEETAKGLFSEMSADLFAENPSAYLLQLDAVHPLLQ